MSIRVYEYPGCSTCQSALKFLAKRGVSFEKEDITKNPPSKKELKEMLSHQGGELKKLFNISGLVYREMKLGEKLPKLSEDEALTLLSKNGKLIKRPFVLHAKGGLVGFKEAEWAKFF